MCQNRLTFSAPPAPRLRRRLPALLVLATLLGCYDAADLIERARNDALRSRLEEIDLGYYDITLPRDLQTGAITEVSLHWFGAAPHYRLPMIKKRLARDEARLRAETLRILRDLPTEHWIDPSFGPLRQQLKDAANRVIQEDLIESVGLYEIRLTQQ